jgi:predicted nucleotidyltransferase
LRAIAKYELGTGQRPGCRLTPWSLSSLRACRLTSSVERWIDVLRDEIELDSVWLFGSRARGERREDSDVDLLVITRGDPERDRQRVWKTIDDVAREMGVNPAVFVPHTWDRTGRITKVAQRIVTAIEALLRA